MKLHDFIFLFFSFFSVHLLIAQALPDHVGSDFVDKYPLMMVKKLPNIKKIEVWKHQVGEKQPFVYKSKTYDFDTNRETTHFPNAENRTRILGNEFASDYRQAKSWNDPITATFTERNNDSIYFRHQQIKTQKFPEKRIIKQQIYDSLYKHENPTRQDITKTSKQYIYNEDHMLVEEKVQISRGKSYQISENVKYTYDTKNRLIRKEKIIYDSDKPKHIKTQIITTYNYYNFGDERLFTKQVAEVGEYITTSKNWEYKYSKNRTRLTYEERGAFDISKYVHEFTYDNEGQLIKTEMSENTNYPFLKGNWIEYKYILR